MRLAEIILKRPHEEERKGGTYSEDEVRDTPERSGRRRGGEAGVVR